MKNLSLAGIIFLLSPCVVLANSIKILSNHWDEKSSLVIFNYKAGDIPFLMSVGLDFFAVDDCQEKFLGNYRTEGNFFIRQNHSFALLNKQTYQIATMLFNYNTLKSVRSVLIRFRGKNNTLPRFLSGCADQSINCCIAIQCYNDTKICLPKYKFGPQSFILFNNY